MRSLFLATALLLLLVALPTPLIRQAQASDNPSGPDVFAGDAYTRSPASATGGLLHFRLGLVADTTNQNGVHRSGWAITPGTLTTITFSTWTTGISPPLPPDGDGTDTCVGEIVQDNGATVETTLFTGTTCPANAATYSWTPTTAGTFRIRVRVVQSNELVNNYNINSDNGGIHDKGALRIGLAVISLTHGGYPAGSTHAYTVAGENIGVTHSHTAIAGGQSTTNAHLRITDASNAAIKTSTVALTGTSATDNFPVDDTFPAASTSAGAEIHIHPSFTSSLTGVRWTHVATATAPTTVVDEFLARRANFINVDPRVTATHLLQADNTFSTPPMSENDPDDARYSDGLGYVATRFTNARGEGLAGASFQFSSNLYDTPQVIGTTEHLRTGLTIGTQGGEAGWGPLRLFNDGAPIGSWTKTADITAPSTIDADTHLVAATKTYTVNSPVGGGEGMGDPLKVFVSPLQVAPEGTVHFAASEAFLDGTARTMNAADTLVYVYDPSGDLVVNGGATTEIHAGIYLHTYTLNATPELGHWVVVIETSDPTTMDPVTTSNTFLVTEAGADLAASLQDHRDRSLELDMHDPTTDFNGLGLDGFLIVTAWFVAFFVMLYMRKVFAAFAAFLGLFDAVTGIMPGSWLFYTLVFILALWLEAIVGDGIYAKWLGWKEKKSGRDAR